MELIETIYTMFATVFGWLAGHPSIVALVCGLYLLIGIVAGLVKANRVVTDATKKEEK